MSVAGANRLASLIESIAKDKKWECSIIMESKHFVSRKDDNGDSYLEPNYDTDSVSQVNIVDCFKEKNRLILDSFRTSYVSYPDNALFEFNFGDNKPVKDVIYIIKSNAKLNGTSLIPAVTCPR